MDDLIDTPKDDDLVYDVGMHQGEDAEFYLRKGFRVVGIEADPDWARFCRDRLGQFIASGQLTIIEGAILEPAAIARAERVRFYKSDRSVWGTVRPDWAARNERLGGSNDLIEVDVIDFTAVLRKYGVPHYLKIDIEGCDMVCVTTLQAFSARPDYLSIESDKTRFTNIRREIEILADLGYDSFQAVEQSGIPSSQTPPQPAAEGNYAAQRFVDSSSGLFGRELGGSWLRKGEVLRFYRAVRLGYHLVGDDGLMSRWRFPGALRLRGWSAGLIGLATRAAVPGWYDTHARHSSVKPREGGPNFEQR
jgi:FkbM family methyltransferase